MRGGIRTVLAVAFGVAKVTPKGSANVRRTLGVVGGCHIFVTRGVLVIPRRMRRLCLFRSFGRSPAGSRGASRSCRSCAHVRHVFALRVLAGRLRAPRGPAPFTPATGGRSAPRFQASRAGLSFEGGVPRRPPVPGRAQTRRASASLARGGSAQSHHLSGLQQPVRPSTSSSRASTIRSSCGAPLPQSRG